MKTVNSSENFSEKVFEICKKIPKGKVSTYKEIGKVLGSKKYRLIGKILSKNRNNNVPCHRVIKNNGEIGGFNRGIMEKIKLLEKEGVNVENNKVNNRHFYKNLG